MLKKIFASLKATDSHTIVSWIGVCLIALLAFNFGGARQQTISMILAGLIFVVGIYLFLDKKETERSPLLPLTIFFLPLGVLTLLTIVSFFWISLGKSSIILNILSALGFVGAILIGMDLRKSPKMPKHAMAYAIMAGLLLLTLANLIASLSDYGFFYMSRYKGMVYFIDGVKQEISKEMAILDGFTVAYVSPEYGSLPLFLLASTLCASLFIKPKEEKVFFCGGLIAGGIGLLSLVLLGNVYALILLVPVYFLAAILRFFVKGKKVPLWERIIAIILLLAVFVLVLFVIVVAAKGNNIYASSKLLSKIFNNGKLLQGVNRTINAVLGQGSWLRVLLGMPAYDVMNFAEIGSSTSLTVSDWMGKDVAWTSFNLHTFEFSALMETGIVGFFSLAVFMVFLFPMFSRYIRSEEGISGDRYIYLALVLSFFLYQSFMSDALPFIEITTYVSPFVLNPTFMLILSIVGYAYTPSPLFMKKERKYEA